MAEPGAQQRGHRQAWPRSTHAVQQPSSIQLTPEHAGEQNAMHSWDASNTTVNSALLHSLSVFMCQCKYVCCVVMFKHESSICCCDLALCMVHGSLHGAWRFAWCIQHGEHGHSAFISEGGTKRICCLGKRQPLICRTHSYLICTANMLPCN